MVLSTDGLPSATRSKSEGLTPAWFHFLQSVPMLKPDSPTLVSLDRGSGRSLVTSVLKPEQSD
jgi:hypothetical protein